MLPRMSLSLPASEAAEAAPHDADVRRADGVALLRPLEEDAIADMNVARAPGGLVALRDLRAAGGRDGERQATHRAHGEGGAVHRRHQSATADDPAHVHREVR